MNTLELIVALTAIILATIIGGLTAGVSMVIAMVIAIVGLDRLPNALIVLVAAAPFAMLML